MMKTIRKLAIVLLMAFAANGVAQTTVPDIERWRGGFRQAESKERIGKEALRQALDVDDFSMYEQAHNEHIASIPLWILAGMGAATSVACCGMGIYSKLTFTTDPHHPATPPAPIFFAISGIAFGAALLPAIPAFVLTLDSHKKLDAIAGRHNQKPKPVSLNMGFTGNGIGLVLNF
ncbi:hypothetical protein [Bacteroides heparinolyticus]|uniref:hypothetical protein n=1 Tax=Prevotella heparinolytica TaxID=28113 RepID=UPI00359F793C